MLSIFIFMALVVAVCGWGVLSTNVKKIMPMRSEP
jgi:hypothetical protein